MDNKPPASSQDQKHLSGLDWLKKYREKICPDCGGYITDATLLGTFWCPKHDGIWKYTRRA